MKLIFAGTGSAFCLYKDNYHSNLLLVDEKANRVMLIDCGSDIRHALFDLGFSDAHITDIYISHVHADHVGGLEWMALTRKFDKNKSKPNLFLNQQIVDELWNHCLSGGLSTISGVDATIEDYFEITPIKANGSFIWGGIEFHLVQTIHFFSGYSLMPSYGLFFTVNNKNIFITTDTQFVPNYMNLIYQKADLIFQDCETSPHMSGVHAHFSELCTLDNDIKKKMWLYHYDSKFKHDAQTNGFCGFVKRGQVFKL